MEILIISSSKKEAVGRASEILGLLDQQGISGCVVEVICLGETDSDKDSGIITKRSLIEACCSLSDYYLISRLPALEPLGISSPIISRSPKPQYDKKSQKWPDSKKRSYFISKGRTPCQIKRIRW
ncbi:MAG TPA: hypothetical protein DCX32_02345 [Candidatus Moranbacteria bacterium]|nr:hypothetical protein [Candidatus Moranbacteria bacterium]